MTLLRYGKERDNNDSSKNSAKKRITAKMGETVEGEGEKNFQNFVADKKAKLAKEEAENDAKRGLRTA